MKINAVESYIFLKNNVNADKILPLNCNVSNIKIIFSHKDWKTEKTIGPLHFLLLWTNKYIV